MLDAQGWENISIAVTNGIQSQPQRNNGHPKFELDFNNPNKPTAKASTEQTEPP
jgi:hypothetical protein